MALLVYREFLDCYEGDKYVERVRMACKREPGAIDYGKVSMAQAILRDLAHKSTIWNERVVSRLGADVLGRKAQSLLRITQFELDHDTTPSDFLGNLDARSTQLSGDIVGSYSDALMLREDPLRLRSLLLR